MNIQINLTDTEPMDTFRLKYIVHGERMAYALSQIEFILTDNAKTVQRSDVLRQVRACLDDIGVNINELTP